MRIGHGIAAYGIRRRSGATNFVLVGFLAGQIVNFIAIAIDNYGTGRSHDGRAAISAVEFHSLATLPFPRQQFVVVFETGDQRVIKLPVVFELVPAARGSDSFRKVDT